MVDLAVLGLQLVLILKVFSNLEDFVISIRLELLAWSPLLHCICTLYSGLCNTEKSHCLCDREAGGCHFSQITKPCAGLTCYPNHSTAVFMLRMFLPLPVAIISPSKKR